MNLTTLRSWLLKAAMLVAMGCAMAACGDRAPTCSDERTIEVVKQIFVDEISGAKASERSQQVVQALDISVETIRTEGRDSGSGKLTCAASLHVEFEAGVIANINRMIEADRNETISNMTWKLRKGGRTMDSDIRYMSQLTDDGKRLVVDLEGIEEAVMAIRFMASVGAFDPQGAPTTVAETPEVVPVTNAPTAASDAALAAPNPRIAPPLPASEPTVAPQSSERTWQPSFDCRAAGTEIERLICASEPLSRADVSMAKVYTEAFASSGDKDALRREQISWRQKVRDTCTDEACVMQAYERRAAALSK
jgi:hypothetical protein